MGTDAIQVSQQMGALASSSGSSTTAPLGSIPIALTRSNFMLWRSIMYPHLAGANLHGYLDGTAAAPLAMITQGTGDKATSTPNPDYHVWWVQDQRVLSGLLSSMTPDVASQMIGRTTSQAVWSAVNEMFGAQSRANARQVRNQLQQLKKKDMSVAEYFHKMKTLADTLAAIGAPVADEELIDYILNGLGSQFAAIAASMTVFNQKVTLTDFYSMLLTFESMQA